ncbi:MAG: hypothetical protein JSW11_07935 [Candidatus Heimdallarchaeota archaeon]|nr:MAG: hypothetical protein JSW11_07935 [Candidatus Heimdallarchaeota archaeon]
MVIYVTKARFKISFQRKFLVILFLSFITVCDVVTTGYIVSIPSIGGNIQVNPRVTHFWQDCNTTFTMSWDDVRFSDVNLAPIDEKYDISHTLFAPSYRSYPNVSFWRYAFLIDELFQGYDIQSHCGKHIHLTEFTKEKQEFYVKWGKTGIEELFGFTPIVFAYPFGDLGGKNFVKKYFDLGRTIKNSDTSWPPVMWHLEGTTISSDGIDDQNLNQIVSIMKDIYHKPGYHVFKGYGHTNTPGKDYGVTDFAKYADTIAQIAHWPNVWYTTWGELTAYEIEKSYLEISKVRSSPNKIEFDVTTPNLGTTVYKIPITIALLLPNSWDSFFPQINGKYSSQFSLKHYADSIELLLDVIPQKEPQRVIIWREAPEIDQTPPEITNFDFNTKFASKNSNKTLKFTLMRFDVTDDQSDIYQVNASIHLKNGKKLTFSKMENPLFWKNSTFGRVVWDSTILNSDKQQIDVEDISYTHIFVQDSFGNIRHSTIFSCGWQKDLVIQGGQSLLHMPNKEDSSLIRLTVA